MLGVRFTTAIRRLHEADWRIIAVRATRRIPVLGSVRLRAVRRLTPPPPDPPEVANIKAELRRRQRLGRAIGLFSLLVLIIAVSMAIEARSFSCLPTAPAPCLPNGFRGHVAALEFARTSGDVAAIVGDEGNPNRAVMKRVLSRDFIFIAAYLVLYLLLAVALSRATSFGPLLIGITVISAVCTAGFDVLENLRALKVLNVPLANLDGAQVAGILDASVIKWIFSFVTIALLSLTFRYGDGLSKFLRALFLLTAVMGLVGLVFHPLIGLSALPLLGGLLVLMVYGLFLPLRLIRDS